MEIFYECESYGLKNQWYVVKYSMTFFLGFDSFVDINNVYFPKISVPHLRNFSPVMYNRYAKMRAVY
jgi:hypothetical protein